MTCPEAEAVAAYLIGALEPGDTASMRAHLTFCQVCRDEVVEVAPVLGRLHRLSVARFEPCGAAPAPRRRGGLLLRVFRLPHQGRAEPPWSVP
jgi:predicted anti-sigma-YlaC factor YlaD